MRVIDQVLLFFAAHADLFFFVSVAAVIFGQVARRKRFSPEMTLVVSWVSFAACLPLFLLYAAIALRRPDGMAFVMAALWGWNAWDAWHVWGFRDRRK